MNRTYSTEPQKVTMYIASPGKYTSIAKGTLTTFLGISLTGVITPM